MNYYSTEPLRVLVVDDDVDFFNFLRAASVNLHLKLDSATTFRQALRKLDAGEYDAFLIDLKLPDGSGFELVEEIRETKKAPIAVISGVYQDEKTFRKLKEELHVEFVLNKPISRENIENLFVRIFNISGEKETSEPQTEWQALLNQYKSSIPNKIDKLSHLIDSVITHPDTSSLTALREEMHKIGGNAGSYGYPEVSTLCKELEHALDDVITGKKGGPADWKEPLKGFISNLKYAFQVPMEQTIQQMLQRGTKVPGFREEGVVVNEDEDFLYLLQRENERFGIPLKTEKNPENALKLLMRDDCNPKAVFISQNFTALNVDAFQFIEKLKKKKDALPQDFGIFLDHDDLSVRIKAEKAGFKYVFANPVSARIVLDALKASVKSDHFRNLRVLILDDDEDVCRFVTESLNEVGVDTRAIQKPEGLLDALNNYMPQVLLLDILLPTYDGISVLKALRSDPTWRDLTVLLITHFKDKSVEDHSYSEHADGIFFKPIDKEMLQKRILELAEWQVISKKYIPEQARVGLDSFAALIQKLQSSLYMHESAEIQLALFEVDHFSSVVLEVGRQQINHFLVNSANYLLAHSSPNMTPYFLERSRFAIVFEHMDPKKSAIELEKLLLNMKRLINADIRLSASLVPITKTVHSSYTVLNQAEKLLDEAAREESPSFVKLKTGEALKKPRKEVIIIDPDKNILNILKMALESQNLSVRTFTSGNEALEAMGNDKEAPPSLIISERQIPDMDGLELLSRVRSTTLKSPPFFFLTVYSSDDDIKKGLESGVKEYITKPFNLTLLTKKALQAVS